MSNKAKLRAGIQAYLTQENIPFMKLNGSTNLLLMKSNSSCHYAVVELFEMEDDYYDKPEMKGFKFNRIISNSLDVIIGKINNYIKL